MTRDVFIQTLQKRIAVVAIAPSTVRNQGKGVLKATRSFLANLDIAKIPNSSKKCFFTWLDLTTEKLLDYLPIKNRPWGTARKVTNIFLRDLLYNTYMEKRYQFSKTENWLELPLDSAVARGLHKYPEGKSLPRWPGLKHLTAQTSELYQKFALEHAKKVEIARVHLDIKLWLENR